MTQQQRNGISVGLLVTIIGAIFIPVFVWANDLQSQVKVNESKMQNMQEQFNKAESKHADEINAIMGKLDVMNATMTDIKIDIRELKDKSIIK